LVHVLGAGSLAALGITAVARLSPPAVVPRSAPASEFSAERAFAHVQAIAVEPHPLGSPAHARVRGYIVDRARDLGLEVREERASSASRVAGNIFSGDVVNVVARLPGRDPDAPAIMLSSHYDSVPQGRGAADDGTAVATLLETARALGSSGSSGRLRRDVLFVFTDGEELGLLGARALVTRPGFARTIEADLNFEARGTHGAVTMFATSKDNGALIDALARSAPRPVANSLTSALAAALPNDTDATAFAEAGIPNLGFALADGLEHYHRYTDDPEHLDLGTLQHDGSYALALARDLGNSEPPARRAGDQAYFDVLAATLVHYSLTAARLLSGAAVAGVVALLAACLRRGRARSGAVVAGAGLWALACLVSLAVPTASRLTLTRSPDLFLSAARYKPFFVAEAALTVLALLLVFRRGLRSLRPIEIALGAACSLAAILVLVAGFAPAATPPLQWALAGWAGFTAVAEATRRPPLALAASYASLALPTLFGAVTAYSFLVATGETMPAVPMLVVGVFSPLFVPVTGAAIARSRRAALVVLAVVAGASAIAGHLLVRYGASYPRANALTYGFDADARRAVWLTLDPGSDAFVGAAVGPGAAASPFPELTRSDRPVRASPAPEVDLAPVRATVLARTGDERSQALTVRLDAAPGVRCLRLWRMAGTVPAGIRIDGQPVHDVVRFSPEFDEAALRLLLGDTTRRGFHLEHCGPSTGLSIDLAWTSTSPEPLELQIEEVIDGLPEAAPRRNPADFVPSIDSDVTLVTRRFAL
jgi:hypothetical protein